MLFSWLFSSKAYLRCVLKCEKIGCHFLCQSLLLSTNVLNDMAMQQWKFILYQDSGKGEIRKSGITEYATFSKNNIALQEATLQYVKVFSINFCFILKHTISHAYWHFKTEI